MSRKYSSLSWTRVLRPWSRPGSPGSRSPSRPLNWDIATTTKTKASAAAACVLWGIESRCRSLECAGPGAARTMRVTSGQEPAPRRSGLHRLVSQGITARRSERSGGGRSDRGTARSHDGTETARMRIRAVGSSRWTLVDGGDTHLLRHGSNPGLLLCETPCGHGHEDEGEQAADAACHGGENRRAAYSGGVDCHTAQQ